MIADNQTSTDQTLPFSIQTQPMQLENEESDWSDVEETRKVPVDSRIQEDGPPPGEVKSKHEVKLAPFKEKETDAERATR